MSLTASSSQVRVRSGGSALARVVALACALGQSMWMIGRFYNVIETVPKRGQLYGFAERARPDRLESLKVVMPAARAFLSAVEY